MLGAKQKRLRFVVTSALLVSAPLAGGCEDPPTVNPAYVEPPPNPVGEQPPTMEGVGVPLPRTTEEPVPVGPNGGHLREALTEQDQAELDRRLLDALGGTLLEGRANPVPEVDAPPPEPVESPSLMISANPVARPEPPPQERPRFAPNPGPDRRDPPSE
jgi:hypothetical protein